VNLRPSLASKISSRDGRKGRHRPFRAARSVGRGTAGEGQRVSENGRRGRHDLGTTNTVAVLRSADGRRRPILFDGQSLMPSAVYLDPSGYLIAGRDAERLAVVDPSRFEPNPKRRIDEAAILLGVALIGKTRYVVGGYGDGYDGTDKVQALTLD
jgi:hypothetical protein